MMRREKILAWTAWASVCFFWGTTYLAIRVGVESLPPALFGGVRFLLAGSILFIYSLARGAARPSVRAWVSLGIVGLLLLAIGNGILVWAEQWIPSGLAALLVATGPFWMVGLDSLTALGDRLTGRMLLGLLLGLCGLALLVAPQLMGTTLDPHYLRGALALQLGCACWCAGSVYAKRRPVQIAPLMAAAVQMLVAGAALTVWGTLWGEWAQWRFTPRTMAAFAYLVTFGSLVGYTSYVYIVQKLPLSIVSLHSYINPVIAVLLGWLLLGETLNWRVGLAATVILCGVAMVKSAPLQYDSTPPENSLSPLARK